MSEEPSGERATVLDDGVQLRLKFVGTDEIPVVFANQFVIQEQADEFILTIAQYAQPMLLGTVEEKREQAQGLPSEWPVKIVGRYGLTRGRLGELVDLLSKARDRATRAEAEAE